VVRDIASGPKTTIDTGFMRKTSLAHGANAIFFTGSAPEGGPAQIFEVAEGHAPVARTTGDTDTVIQATNTPGTALLFTNRPAGGGRGGGGGRAGGPGAPATFGVLSLVDGRTTSINGSAPAFSRDGASFTYVAREGAENRYVEAAARAGGSEKAERF